MEVVCEWGLFLRNIDSHLAPGEGEVTSRGGLRLCWSAGVVIEARNVNWADAAMSIGDGVSKEA